MQFLRVDTVLCKSYECYKQVTKWFEQYKSRRDAKARCTKHTFSSSELFVRKCLGEYAVEGLFKRKIRSHGWDQYHP